ncbi:16S rRNA (cytidine(1402)-2'-O)-methyltransferase [Enterococcus sp. DIV0242_7C1]|uniref:Ribosomal RNA small subunit methyltransferase I n=1 Tax=Candidatus Enterococcus dunnyi TaxID=1834192 RepID=A0A200JBR9_9ENTE|nr:MULTISPECIES: 16S rRNA (cytidine(1402)-2'-O)-methyltransferase [unclassified Enterococcus]MBO0471819.1 16S rRNA (cytidine(1402)-2'-O)-methyltransferase [Enterococcus sp. DIV0242_7C1]OUZ34676.1 tetrapyrrole methylase [Enterococcus sp. 9D6_DIV0238]
MQKQKSFDSANQGQLYLVPTPIGNLEDMSVRCINIMKEATIIASEDTRNTQKLLNHFEISTPQISFHEHNYKERIPQFIERLASGEMIAQVSDAGMPSISDPGHELVTACIENDIKVIALPGPTAGITALIASGLSPQPFTFYGFLPRKKKEQLECLEQLKQDRPTQIFYESPHRIATTVKHVAEVFGEERKAVICRELTKLHEEYLRGTLAELRDYLADHTLKGECCLLVEGFSGETLDQEELHLSIKEHIEFLIDEGLSSKEAIKEVAKQRNLKKQEVYKEYHIN